MKCGKPLEALSLYCQMQNKDNSFLDARTFVAVLKACATLRDLEIGRKVHAHVSESGLLKGNKFIASTLVDMYAKCNCIPDAKRVFDMLEDRDVVSWTAIVGACAENGDADEALLYFEQMQHVGISPNTISFICSLKACTSIQRDAKGQEIHCEIERLGLLDKDVNLGNSLVDMYAKCGCLSKALEVFVRLPMRDVITWTALVGGYVEYSCDEEALKCLERMKANNVRANFVTLVCGLKACSSVRALDKGREIHAEIEKHGWLVSDAAVGNALIDMYAKCGSLAKAHQVLDTLPKQSNVSWSTLINGYTEHGLADEALNLFRQMCSAGVSPDAVTYVCCLKACGSTGALAEGQVVHAEIERKGLLQDSVIGNALVHMYGKCGTVAKAEEVFERLSVHNVVSWNALLSGYLEGGHAEEAIQYLDKMRLEGIFPDAVTFVCVLKACGEVGLIDKGLEIHAEIERHKSLEGNVGIGNTLVDMYAGCGLLKRARQLFDRLPSRNVISWNALISGHTEQGDDNEVICCLEQMQSEGPFPDIITYMCTLKACGALGAREKVRRIHEELERRSLLNGSIDVSNTLIDSYAKCGLLKMASHVFNTLTIADSVSWNVLIAGYNEHGQHEEAIKCFTRMQSRGASPDPVTFICILKALGSMGVVTQGEEIHAEIERQGMLQRDVVISSTLIDMYAKCGAIAKAQSVFDKLRVPGVISWTALMSGYAQLGQSQDVFALLDRMLGERIEPDMVTFVIVLSVCSRNGLFDKSQMYFEVMREHYGILPSLEHQACLVNALGRVGELEKAVALIRKFSVRPNLVAWHVVLASCRSWGSFKVGEQAFEQVLLLDRDNALSDDAGAV
ncbi:hypothetical protein GOP47_0030425 [Adiantum capillus-veneris]|nr:hypothetical protein GOP47_0030425 [Adiantum capillus-veneris]